MIFNLVRQKQTIYLYKKELTMLNEDKITRNYLSLIRKKAALLREENEKSNAIAITDDPRFGNNALSSQIEQFRASVESGAEFAEPSENVADCPLIYMPDEKNLVFSGIIPCLNNLKWQFKLKTNTGNGCFVWADGLIVNKDNLQILNKLYGFYLNWKEQWNASAAELDKMVQNINQI